MLLGNKYVNKEEKLEPGKVYHVYNKAIGDELLFRNQDDYYFFLQKLERYIFPVANIYSYCLIPNHFHFLIQTRKEDVLIEMLKRKSIEDGGKLIQQSFSNFFNSYSKSYNKSHNRAGRLFLYSYKRILVDRDDYMLILINYIHRNPIHHGLVKDFFEWKYSSYNAILSNKATKLSRDFVLSYFTSNDDFIAFHNENKTKPGLEKYWLE